MARANGVSTKIGGWLFSKRGLLPLVIFAYPIAFTRGLERGQFVDIIAGFALLFAGEAIRLWSVGFIGSLSRSKHGTVKELVAVGPYGMVRNPIYVGNGLQWVGIGFLGGVRWYVPVIGAFFIVIYGLIVRWEEALLEEKFGAGYREYAAEVPRWFPRHWVRHNAGANWELTKALASEKSTFRSLGAIVALIIVKYITLRYYWPGG